MAVARDDLGRAARKRGIEGQATIIRHFGIRCMRSFFEFKLEFRGRGMNYFSGNSLNKISDRKYFLCLILKYARTCLFF